MTSIRTYFSGPFYAAAGRIVLSLALAGILTGTESLAQSLVVQLRPSASPAVGSIAPTNSFAITNLPQSVAVTAQESNPAYAFDHWEMVTNASLDFFSDINAQTIVVNVTSTNSPALIRAHYRSRGLSLIVTAEPSAGGYTQNPGLGTNWFATNELINITATASNGYQFVSWSGAASGNANPASFRMGGNQILIANFVKMWNVTQSKVTGPSAGTPTVFTLRDGTYTNIDIPASITEVSGGQRYRCNGWTNGVGFTPPVQSGASFTSVPLNPVATNTSWTWLWMQQFKVDIIPNPSGNITIQELSPDNSSNDGWVDAGTSVRVTVTANNPTLLEPDYITVNGARVDLGPTYQVDVLITNATSIAAAFRTSSQEDPGFVAYMSRFGLRAGSTMQHTYDDPDKDGLDNQAEYRLSSTNVANAYYNPINSDTDNDGMDDNYETYSVGVTGLTEEARANYRPPATDNGSGSVDSGPEGNSDSDFHWSTTDGYMQPGQPLMNIEEYRGPDNIAPYTNVAVNFGDPSYPFPSNPAGSRPTVYMRVAVPGDTGDQSKGNTATSDRDVFDDGFEYSWDQWQHWGYTNVVALGGGRDEAVLVGVTNGVAVYLTNTIPSWTTARVFNPGRVDSVDNGPDYDVLYDYLTGKVSQYYYSATREYSVWKPDALSPGVVGAPHSIRMDSPPAGELEPRRSSHPFMWDVDQDGLPDGYEVIFGYDPWGSRTVGHLRSDGQDNPDDDWMALASTNDVLSLRNYEVYLANGFDTRVAWAQFYPTPKQMPGPGSMASPTTSRYSNEHEMRGPDGMMTLIPVNPGSGVDDATNPFKVDSDGDGIWDGWENYVGLNASDAADSGTDSDKDLLTAREEFLSFVTSSTNRQALQPLAGWNNKIFPTDPNDKDTDGDALLDGKNEKAFFTATSVVATNLVLDEFGDIVTQVFAQGVWNGKCYTGGGLNPASSDTDQDTLPDPYEACYPTADNPGLDGTVGDSYADPDRDKVPNYLEYYSCSVYHWQYDAWQSHAGSSYDSGDFYGGTNGTPKIWDWSQLVYNPMVGKLGKYGYAGAAPNLVDSDTDGMDDYYEIYHGLNPAYGVLDLIISRDLGAPIQIGIYSPYVGDPRTAPYVNGSPFMDSDGDGLPNSEESVFLLNPTQSPQYHTDPTPMWITDMAYGSSWVNLYYIPGSFWPWSGLFPPPIYAYDFESNEGFDTDNDGFSDREELVVSQTDPLSFERPLKRRALYLPPGQDACVRTFPGYAFMGEELRSFTVEAWIRPINPATGTNQVVVERPLDVPIGNPMYVPGIRVNFRLGIDPAGLPYIAYHGEGNEAIFYQAKASTTSRISAGNWTHLSGTYQVPSATDPSQRGVLTLYVNGQLAAQTNPDELPSTARFGNGTLVFQFGAPIVIGASDRMPSGDMDVTSLAPSPQPFDFFKGWIDEVRVWEGARSQGQVISGMKLRMKQKDVVASFSSPVPVMYHFSFDNLPDPDHTPTAPAGLGFDVTGNAIYPSDYTGVGFWATEPSRSMVYAGVGGGDPRYLPWIENTVGHVPKIPPVDIGDPNVIQNVMDGTNIVGQMVPFRNTSDPYGIRHITFPARPLELANGFIMYDDALPLGWAAADEDIALWDNGGVPALDPFSSLGDGIPDAWKEQYGFDPFDTSVADGDPDQDGLSNYYEYLCGSNPRAPISGNDNLPDGEQDADGDGLSNIQELQHGTLPNVKDTDDDGLTDWEELSGKTDPGWVRPANSSPPKVQSDPLNPLSPAVQRSVYLNGASRLIVPPSDKLVSKNWTVEAWVNPDSGSAGGVIATRYVQGFDTSEYGINYEIGLSTNSAPAGMLRPYVRYMIMTNGAPRETRVDGLGTSITNSLVGVLIPATGTWTHVAGVCNGASNVMSLYVNGKLAAYRTDLISLSPTVYGYGNGHRDDEVTIGASRSTGVVSNGFKGYLDNVRIWAMAREAGEILERYNAPEGMPSASTSLPLKSGSITTIGGMSQNVATLANHTPVRVLVKFADEATARNTAALTMAGIQVLNYVAPGVRAVKATQQQLAAMGETVTWTGLLEPSNKIASLLNVGAGGNGTRKVLVTFFKDVSQADAVQAVRAVGGLVYNDKYIAGSDLVATVNDAQLADLASNNGVAWVAPAAAFLTSGRPVYKLSAHVVGGVEVAPFVTRGEGWDGPGRGAAALTYHFVNFNCNLPQDVARKAVMEPLATWAQYAALTFTETAIPGLPYSMDIGWEVIDGPSGILGMGYYPNDINPEPIAGDFLLDSEETWKDGMAGTGIDLRYVALHEQGHCLGMAHSDDPSAVMYPYYDGSRDATLAPDDIAGIQSIYGASLGTSGLAEYRFDDGGTSAQDFSVKQDWKNGWAFAATLDGAVFSTNTVAPLNKDSDGDGLPDWWEMANSLNAYDAAGVNGAYGDPDGDGLSNLGEYLAGTNPHMWSTADNTFSDYDSRQGPGFRTFGELFDDGDAIPDLWESLYPGPCPTTNKRGLDPAYYDANQDPDEDGWDNYSEYMGAWLATLVTGGSNAVGDRVLVRNCDPLNPDKYPMPMVEINVRYSGKYARSLEDILSGNTDVKLSFYHSKNMDGIPDATLNLRDNAGVNGLPTWWTQMHNLTGDANGDPDGDGWSNLDEFLAGTNPWVKDDVLELPAGVNVSGAKTRVFTTGHIRQGQNYVFGYLDLNNDDQWDPDLEPAGIAQFQPVNLGWDDLNTLEIGLTDQMPGYPRFTWPVATNAAQYTVSCPLVTKTIVGRNYFHEGDWLAAGLYGVTTADVITPWSIYADGVAYTNVLMGNFPRASSLVASEMGTPNGSMQFQYARNEMEFKVDTNSTAYRVQFAATSNGVALLSYTNIVPYMDINGVRKITVPFFAGDNYIPPGGNYASATWGNGLYWMRVQGFTRGVTSTWSPWGAFLLNVQPPSVGGKSMISGDVYYFGKVGHGYGTGQTSNLTIIVQAFQSPGFSGVADGQVQVTYTCQTNAPSVNKGSYSMKGLRNVPYYVRAFIDENGNRQLDSWEPMGFVQEATTNGYVVAPVDLTSGSGSSSKSDVRVVIRDRDTDDDGLPDGWEWMYYGALSTMSSNIAANGLTVLRNYEIEPADLDPTKTDYDNDGVPDPIEIDWANAKAGIPANSSHVFVAVNWSNLVTDVSHVYNPYDAFTNPGGTDLNPTKWDTDGDGLSDGYEITHGLDPLNRADGAAKIASARAAGEAIPGIPSVSQIAVVTPGAGQFSLTWQGQMGMHYEVQYSDDLKTWQSAPNGATRYGEAIHNYVDLSPRVNTRFYRVVVR